MYPLPQDWFSDWDHSFVEILACALRDDAINSEQRGDALRLHGPEWALLAPAWQLRLAQGPLSLRTFPFHQRVATIRKRCRIVTSLISKITLLYSPYSFCYCLGWFVCQRARLLVRSGTRTGACSEERYFFVLLPLSPPLFLAWSDSSTYLVSFVITENASYCA